MVHPLHSVVTTSEHCESKRPTFARWIQNIPHRKTLWLTHSDNQHLCPFKLLLLYPTPTSLTFPAFKKNKIKTNRKQTRSKLVEWNPCRPSKCWKNPDSLSVLLCRAFWFHQTSLLMSLPPSCPAGLTTCCLLAGDTARSTLWVKPDAGLGWGGAWG